MTAATPSLESPRPQDEAPQETSSLFPAPEFGLRVAQGTGGEPGQMMNMLQLVQIFEEATGEQVEMSDDARTVLRSTEAGFMSSCDVPAEQVYPVFESVLWSHRFALTDVSREEPRTLKLWALDGPKREELVAHALRVPLAEVALYEDHCALLIQVSKPLEHLDSKSTHDALWSMVVNPRTTQVLEDPLENYLVVIGTGSQVNNILRVIEHLEAKARAVAMR